MSITELNIADLTKAIQELSKQLEASKESNKKEKEVLTKYKDDGTILELTLVTTGLIKGRIAWLDDQCLGIETVIGQSVILYKQTIAFIQEKTA